MENESGIALWSATRSRKKAIVAAGLMSEQLGELHGGGWGAADSAGLGSFRDS